MTAATAVQAAYLVAALLFILSLAGLSKHETAKSGIWFGISGMAIALAATIGLAVHGESGGNGLAAGGVTLLVGATVVGAAIGLWRARIVQMTGMPELIARDDAAFIETAIRFGNDRSVLTALHQRLAAQRETSGLFDMAAYTEDFATLVQRMHANWRSGSPPKPITLEAPARAPDGR